MKRRLLCLCVLASLAAPDPLLQAADDSHDVIRRYLEEGHLAEGLKTLETRLAAGPEDSLQFQLGIAQFFVALEKLEQDWFRLGLHDSLFAGMIPFLRLPVPQNARPEKATNESARKAVADFVTRLGGVADTLAKVGNNNSIKVTLRPALVRLDFDGNGTAGEEEVLWKIFERVVPGARLVREDLEGFSVNFDLGDARWLQGYCHLLSAIGDLALAHDTERLFQHTGSLFFADAESSFDFLRQRNRNRNQPDNMFSPRTDDMLDGIAFIHLLSFSVKDPPRMGSSLRHLQEVTRLSRESWKAILEESDDDHEWLPGPKQTSVMGGTKLTPEMIQGWMGFLDETDAILAGKKLLPFWREAGGRGINLNRVFTEPKTLDVILWIQGTGAAPYLENGTITSVEFWETTNRIFRGQFLGFALWFN